MIKYNGNFYVYDNGNYNKEKYQKFVSKYTIFPLLFVFVLYSSKSFFFAIEITLGVPVNFHRASSDVRTLGKGKQRRLSSQIEVDPLKKFMFYIRFLFEFINEILGL